MATLVVKRADLYPATTKVKVFQLPVPEQGELQKNNSGSPATWKPALTELTELTVTSGGKLEVSIGSGAGELPAGVSALCWAQVGGSDVYLRIRSPETAKEAV